PPTDAYGRERDLQPVHRRDVPRTVDVLEDLRRLGDPRRRYRYDTIDRLGVERTGHLEARRCHAPNDLGDRRCSKLLISRVLALGRKREAELFADAEATCDYA